MPPARKKNSDPKSKVKAQTCEPSSTSSPPPKDRRFCLKRGKACLICRSKKIKCDGVRPQCGFCEKFSRKCKFDDPETWGKQRQLQYQVEDLAVKLEAARQESSSLVQTLEDQKALNQKLQGQIHPMFLIHTEPVLGLTFTDTMPQVNTSHTQQEFDIVFDSPSFSSSADLSPLSSIDSMIFPDLSPIQGQERSTVDLINFSQPASSAIFDVKLTENTQSMLLHASLPHLSQCCLDISKAEVLSRFTQGGVQALRDCLLYALFTVSCRFSADHSEIRQHERRFRQRVQFALRPQAMPLLRKDVFDSVRATIALAMYFYMDDYLKEATTHIAVAFGYILELDKAGNHPDICAVARACSQEERLVVQCAYIVDRSIATQIESPAIFPGEIEQVFRVDQALNNTGLGFRTRGGSTVSQPTTPSLSPGGNRPPLDQSSLIQLRMRCASLVYDVSLGMKKLLETNTLFTEARELRGALPSIYVAPSSSTTSNIDLTVLSMHTQVFATLTKLTRRCLPREEKSLEMSGEVVALIHELRDEDFVLLDPIVGVCWEWTIDSILGELSSLSLHPDEERIWITRVQFILMAMKKFAAHLPVVCVNIANISLQCCAWKITV